MVMKSVNCYSLILFVLLGSSCLVGSILHQHVLVEKNHHSNVERSSLQTCISGYAPFLSILTEQLPNQKCRGLLLTGGFSHENVCEDHDSDTDIISPTIEYPTRQVISRQKGRKNQQHINHERKKIRLSPRGEKGKLLHVLVSDRVKEFFERQHAKLSSVHEENSSTKKKHLQVFALVGKIAGGDTETDQSGSGEIVSARTLPRKRRSVKTSTSKLDGPLDREVRVLAAMEVNDFVLYNKPGNLKVSERTLQRIIEVAKSLQLDVVGCAVIGATESNGGGVGKKLPLFVPFWSAAHVHFGLQSARCIAKEENADSSSIFHDLIILSVGGVGNGNVEYEGNRNGRGIRSRDKFRASRDKQIGMEAFRFSKQALELYSQQILTAVPLQTLSQESEEHRTKSRGKSRRREETCDNDVSDSSFGSHVSLNGSVLVNTREESVIEAILLAVPLPLSVISNHPRPIASSFAPSESFSHIFPTKSERTANIVESKTYLRRFLTKLLGAAKVVSDLDVGINRISVPAELAHRLLDPHLLLSLRSSIDKSLFAQLCSALRFPTMEGESVLLPASLLSIFSTLNDSLEHGQQDRNADHPR